MIRRHARGLRRTSAARAAVEYALIVSLIAIVIIGGRRDLRRQAPQDCSQTAATPSPRHRAAPADPEDLGKSARPAQVHVSSRDRPRPRRPLDSARAGTALDSTAVATAAGVLRTDRSRPRERLRRSSRVPDHHRQTARLGLEEDDPPGLALEAEQPGPARHREDVPGVDVRRDLLPRHPAGEHHRVLDPRPGSQLLQPLPVGSVPDDQQPRVGDAAAAPPARPGSACPVPCAGPAAPGRPPPACRPRSRASGAPSFPRSRGRTGSGPPPVTAAACVPARTATTPARSGRGTTH